MHYEIAVAVPYRLDLTISVLRRLSANIVDVLTADGRYIRALSGFEEPVLASVGQERPNVLDVVLGGDEREHPRALALVRRMLGVDCDLGHFNRTAESVGWLRPLAGRMLGVKPPRYPTLWEACVNAVVFQQVSIAAASAIVRRLIVAFGPPLDCDGIALHAFPSVDTVARAGDPPLLKAGLSAGKLATLRRVGDALLSGTLDEAMLEERSSSDAALLLGRIKGIGPWTATVILLRGLGRLDVFPRNDSGVARNLASLAGATPVDIEALLAVLAPQQGMLYYHLLLSRLEERGEIGRPSRY